MMKSGRPRFYKSRAGTRWRSRPEACLSNFLYARGVKHWRGERYPDEFAKVSGQKYCRYDLHFVTPAGEQIDVEIWGDFPEALSRGRYSATRAQKEAFHEGSENFLGLHHLDCLQDTRLTDLLKRHIGIIEPFRFEQPSDHHIESAHWTDGDDLLETCRRIAAEQPDGIFPSEEWLRKRGRYAGRPGNSYPTLAKYIAKYLGPGGGIRKVRKLLGQAGASTTKWTPEAVMTAWRKFELDHGMTPTNCKGMSRRGQANGDVIREGARIYEVARRLKVVDLVRSGQTTQKRKLKPHHVETE